MRQFFKFVFASCLGSLLALALLVFIIIGFGAGMASKNLSGRSSKTVEENTVLKLTIPAELPEQTNNTPVRQISFDNDVTIGIHDFAKAIKAAASDPKIKGIYLTDPAGSHGYASLHVIRDAMQEFKKSGKFIYCFSKFMDQNSYYLASIADKIYMHPLGFTDLKGFQVAIPFYKELMEKIGLKFNIYYAGQFKSATEPFRLEKMSEQNRVQLSEFLHDRFDTYLEEVSEARNMPQEELKKILDQYLASSPEKAKDLKLIDSLAYETDIITAMKSSMGIQDDQKIQLVSVNSYFDNVKDKDTDFGATNRIAVLYAEGDIIDANGEEGQIGRNYLKTIREIRKNNSIKALVLRVNSRGGSAIQSDEMLKELDLLKNAGKPVVVSMGDYAASGGYYISCHADSIFADKHTLTGSIGVFAMIPDVSTMLDKKIGVDFDTISTGPMAAKFNPTFPWGKAEGDIIQNNIDHTYDTFLGVVAGGRNKSKDEIHAIAQGRIWSARQAEKNGLISKTGSLEDAIVCAARMASLDRYRTSEYPTRKDAITRIIDKIQGNDNETKSKLSETVLKASLGEYYIYYSELMNLKKNNGIQMKMIYPVEIR